MLTTLNKSEVLSPTEKKERIQLHRLYHTALLQQFNVPDADFNVKLVFTNNGQKVIGVFPNEFTKKNGFYIEFVDKTLTPTDPDRKVYRLDPVDNFESVYNILQSGSYAVPIDELTEVTIKKVQQPLPEFTDLNKSTDRFDEHFSKMTIKDLASILWQSPVSDKKWLNDLIIESKQQQVI